MNDVLSQQLLEEIKDPYEGLNARLREVKYEWTDNDFAVAGNYYYLPFALDGTPTLSEFVDFIYYKIVSFCVPRAEREQQIAKSHNTSDPAPIHALVEKARSLFIQARKSQVTSGEPGELILFILLEAALQAPQIACKMSLKTSPNMPVHGADAVHARVGTTGNNLMIVWGESKTHKSLSKALTDTCTSIAAFLQDNEGLSQREHEITLVKANLNIKSDSLREIVLRHLDPFSEEANDLEEMFACFVAYDEPHLAQPGGAGASRDEIETKFRLHYQTCVSNACAQLGEKLRAQGLAKLNLHFFLIPVPHVKELRSRFFKKFGIEVESDEELDTSIEGAEVTEPLLMLASAT
jgi:hypothetical protein